jgi:FHA domain-containing protein
LFNLAPENKSEPFAPDSPLAPSLQQSGNVNPDPFVALGVASEKKRSREEPQRDDVPELQGSFHPPAAKPDPAMRAVLPVELQRQDSSPPEPYGMFRSWDNNESGGESGEIKSLIIPSPGQERRKGDRRRGDMQPVNPAGPTTEKIEALTSVDASLKEIARPQEVPRHGSQDSKSITDREELLRAFLGGAGVPDVTVPGGLTPEFMSMLGQLLRESTQGTLHLLLARTLTKREVRAELTMIAPKENNPLKFSPTVEAALAHLLAPHGRGFMPPLQAMKDAHNDLRSHQFGFMAGMRAALAGVLERFHPLELERRITRKTMLDALLPINRKAKLWDLFAERYKDISHEAEEDFHVLFGREFLRAYEAQIAKLEQDEKR